MKKNIILVALYFFVQVTFAQSDCISAIDVCGNNTSVAPGQFTNTGSVNDESNASCWSGSGSSKSVWYTFSPQSAGQLGFQLDPNPIGTAGDPDYDYALFDITNGCANMSLISCNFSADNGNTGMTQTNSDYTDSYDTFFGYPDCWGNDFYSANEDCGPWNESEYVVPTKIYALMINLYGGTDTGFELDFDFQPGLVDVGCPIVLPIELLSFSSTCTNDAIQINWQTATEINNDYFVIEKAYEDHEFFEIATISGVGFSQTVKSYSIFDKEISSLKTYYRLAQVDFNGAKTYKGIINTEKCTQNLTFSSFYNSSTNSLILNYNVKESFYGQFKLYDIQGVLLINENIYFDKDNNNISITPKKHLSQSVYVLQIIGDKKSYTEKIFIQ